MLAMMLDRCGTIEERPLRAVRLPVPEPGAGEVALRVLACGVCRTDLHAVEGDLDLPVLPLVPGHQIVGRITATSPGLDPALVGSLAGVAWMGGACLRCPTCLSGQENLCPDARFTGFHRHGGFAESTTAHAEFTVPLPESFLPEQAAPLLCAGIIGFRALRLAGALAGGDLGLWGFGASAHLALQIARYHGCRVSVVSRSPDHRRLATSLGAAWAGAPEERQPWPLDRAVIFSPAGDQVLEALLALRPGGVVVCAGVTMSDLPPLPYELLYGERVLRSVTNATRQDARDLMALATSIPLRPRVEVLPLDQANEALARVKHSQVNGALVLIP